MEVKIMLVLELPGDSNPDDVMAAMAKGGIIKDREVIISTETDEGWPVESGSIFIMQEIGANRDD